MKTLERSESPFQSSLSPSHLFKHAGENTKKHKNILILENILRILIYKYINTNFV